MAAVTAVTAAAAAAICNNSTISSGLLLALSPFLDLMGPAKRIRLRANVYTVSMMAAETRPSRRASRALSCRLFRDNDNRQQHGPPHLIVFELFDRLESKLTLVALHGCLYNLMDSVAPQAAAAAAALPLIRCGCLGACYLR